MQELRERHALVKKQIPLDRAFRHGIYDVVFVSHRWETPDAPDSKGEQLSKLQGYLESKEEVAFVWYGEPHRNLSQGGVQALIAF